MSNHNTMLSNIPSGLLALLIFSALTSIFSGYYYMLANESLRDALVPHVGWIGLFFYIYLLFFSAMLIATRKDKLRKITIFTFLFFVCYGLLNLFIHFGKDNYGNPYLTYGVYRPVWDIAIPLFWIFILSTKRVKEYCDVSI